MPGHACCAACTRLAGSTLTFSRQGGEPGLKLAACNPPQPCSSGISSGCYFTRVLLEPAFVDPLLGRFLVEERLRQFMVSVMCIMMLVEALPFVLL